MLRSAFARIVLAAALVLSASGVAQANALGATTPAAQPVSAAQITTTARNSFRQGNFDAACTLYSQLITMPDADQALANFYLGNCALLKGNYKSAEDYYNAARTIANAKGDRVLLDWLGLAASKLSELNAKEQRESAALNLTYYELEMEKAESAQLRSTIQGLLNIIKLLKAELESLRNDYFKLINERQEQPANTEGVPVS